MRIYRSSYKDRQGQTKETLNWYGEFRDQEQRIRRIPLLKDKAASTETGRKVERLVALRISGEAPDAELTRWLATVPKDMLARLAHWGIVDASRVAANKALDQHLAEYAQDLRSEGNTVKHAELTLYRAKRVIEGCGFHQLTDLNAEAVRAYLNKLWKTGEISGKTYGYYVRELKAFTKWLLRTGRSRDNPLQHLEGLGAKAVARDAGKKRRALTPDEIRRLLAATAVSVFRWGLAGPDRALVYRLAIETGLRSSEVATLTRASFRLDVKPATVFVPGCATKNARDAELPLRAATVALLREHLKLKLPGAIAFSMPANYDTARMIRADLAEAGIKEEATSRYTLDFHMLRHTFLTLLASSGVHPKVAQDLARHSDINLTLSRYSHSVMEQRSEAVDRLPDFDPGTRSVEDLGADKSIEG